jgi:hypothetical protein
MWEFVTCPSSCFLWSMVRTYLFQNLLLLWYSHILKIFHCFVIEIYNFSFNNAKDATQEVVLLLIYTHHGENVCSKGVGTKLCSRSEPVSWIQSFPHKELHFWSPAKNCGTNAKFFCKQNSCVKSFPAWEIHFLIFIQTSLHLISSEGFTAIRHFFKVKL